MLVLFWRPGIDEAQVLDQEELPGFRSGPPPAAVARQPRDEGMRASHRMRPVAARPIPGRPTG